MNGLAASLPVKEYAFIAPDLWTELERRGWVDRAVVRESEIGASTLNDSFLAEGVHATVSTTLNADPSCGRCDTHVLMERRPARRGPTGTKPVIPAVRRQRKMTAIGELLIELIQGTMVTCSGSFGRPRSLPVAGHFGILGPSDVNSFGALLARERGLRSDF